MPIRFRKTWRVLPFVKVNFGKKGFAGVTIGGRWFSVNFSRQGIYWNTSFIGTGFSYRKKIERNKRTNTSK